MNVAELIVRYLGRQITGGLGGLLVSMFWETDQILDEEKRAARARNRRLRLLGNSPQWTSIAVLSHYLKVYSMSGT